eukprot:gene3366-3851_t
MQLDPRPFLSGVAAGVVAGVIGHPLDTIKVRLQSHPGDVAGGALGCARRLVRQEGGRALFKGLGPQLVGYCAHSAIRFGVFGNNAALPSAAPQTPVQKGVQGAWAGAMAGVALSPLISVLELLKCRQQVSREVPQPPLRAVLGHLLRNEGLAGLACGYLTCLPRNIIGNGIMFGLFEGLQASVQPRLSEHAAACSPCEIFWLWFRLLIFPIDAVKTNIVTVQDPAHRQTARQVAARLWSEGGL